MNKEAWGGFQPVAHTYIKQHTDYEGNVMFSVPAAIAEGAAAKINFALSAAKPYEFYTFDANGDHTVDIVGGCHDVPGNYGFTLTVGDTPEQLGTVQAADAIMIDGKIVTREDVRRLQSEIEAFKSLYSAAKGSVDKLNEMLRGAKEERNALAATLAESFGDGYYEGFIDGAKHQDNVDLNTKSAKGLAKIKDEAMRCSEIAENAKSKRNGIVSRQELAATVEALRKAIIEYDDCDTASQSKKACSDMIALAKATQQQHLRDVRAEAGRAGFIAGYNSFALYDRPHAAIEKANKYASGVKDGVE